MGSRRRAWRWRWTQRRQPRQCQALQSVRVLHTPKLNGTVTTIITENLQFKGYLPVSDAGSNTGIITENV